MTVRGQAGADARFDSLDGSGRSVQFDRPAGEIAAWSIDRVAPAIREVERAVSEGLHAGGFIAYEAAPGLDPTLTTHPGRPDLPLAWFRLYERRSDSSAPEAPSVLPVVGPWTPSVAASEHADAVRRVRELLAAGDTYQVNLTFQLEAALDGDARSLYAAMCRSQRAGYCALVPSPFGTVVSASPELFFRWAGSELTMRPMKGTRPRGRWTDEDESLARELLDSPKERAENLMIVDLLRNDAGRVAEFGTVSVPELFRVERYPTVHQLTSTVAARTRPGTTLLDVLRAIFPCGSVTGAPKVRTMQIIRELEDRPRGVYTGAVGFVSPGEAVFNVPIRTLLVHGDERRVEMGVGSGITHDSLAGAELAECMQKAAFVHRRFPETELLETMRHDPETGFHLLDAHLRRLEDSARYFGTPLDAALVRRRLESAVGWDEHAPDSRGRGRALRVRLVVDSAGEPRVECRPLDDLPPVLRARLSTRPVDSGDGLLYHKTTAREAYESRRAEFPDHDEVLLMNERGELTEFTTGNLVLVLDGEWVTPPIASGVLPGVARAALLASGDVRERVVTPADLDRAEAVLLVNSVRDRVAVRVER